jgi:pimeloyl-ACP methyl ester carboxylesterase
VLQVTLKVDSGQRIEPEGALSSGVTVSLPADPRAAKAALVCLAGGNMNRRYFDLQSPGDSSFSFAHAMTERGFVVIAIDHLGLGDSSKPADGYALTPDVLVAANKQATAEVMRRLHEGRLIAEVPPLPTLRTIGVGHSMGAMMTILQQAAGRQHIAIAPLGFSTRGLPEYTPEDVRKLSQAEQRAQVVELARRMFRDPYPVIRSSGGSNAEFYGSRNVDPKGVAALKAATDCLLPVPGFMSMLPDNVTPEAATIDVPVFLGLGEKDMAGPPHQAPAAFVKSRDVTLYLQPAAGHSHFLFPTRSELFARFGAWAEWVVNQSNKVE